MISTRDKLSIEEARRQESGVLVRRERRYISFIRSFELVDFANLIRVLVDLLVRLRELKRVCFQCKSTRAYRRSGSFCVIEVGIRITAVFSRFPRTLSCSEEEGEEEKQGLATAGSQLR